MITTLPSALADEPPDGVTRVALFTPGVDGYPTFRLEALAVSTKGTILAFTEGRKGGSGVHGDVDLMLRRSFDGGKTWGPIQIAIDNGPDTVCYPTPLVDRDTGTIWLAMCMYKSPANQGTITQGKPPDTCHAWISHSDDDQFVREQIAGDLMADPAIPATTARTSIATGFLALGPKSLDEIDAGKQESDVIDEQVTLIGKGLLGLTMDCARCHDHKFDPIPNFADPKVVSGRRTATTVAPQALFFLNSEFVLDASGAMADNLLQQEGLDDADRVRLAYELTFARPPDEEELRDAIDYVTDVYGQVVDGMLA